MNSGVGQKRKRQDGNRAKNKLPRKTKRAAAYHSSSEEEEDDRGATDAPNLDDASEQSGDDAIDLPNLRKIIAENGAAHNNDDEEEEAESDSESDADDDDDQALSDASERDGTKPSHTNKRNRNDPSKLATSISSILASKLTTSQRADPILSRSAAATATSKEVSESKLEAKARRKLRDEKRSAKERGRVKDVLGLEDTTVSTAEVAEAEKRLRKTAQRGVVKLFNAVRAAQVKGEEAAREAGGLVAGGTQTAVLGTDRRKERVTEMSKKGFLDLLAGGGAAA